MCFYLVFENEDYCEGELQQQIIENAELSLGCGCNHPALHWYHDTFHAALRMSPLEAYAGRG